VRITTNAADLAVTRRDGLVELCYRAHNTPAGLPIQFVLDVEAT
jgi:hypothetical protein